MEPSATPAPPPGRRLAGLDGLRGLAALYVVVNHLFLRAFPGYPVDNAPFWAGPFIYGRFAVLVFIVLSGFSLALSPARHGWRLGELSAYAGRRARRILPPYWAALAFSLAVAWLIVPQPFRGVPDPSSVLANGLLVQNIASGPPSPNTAFWSIAVEVQLYVLLPVLLLMVRKRGALAMLGGGARRRGGRDRRSPRRAPGHLRDPVRARPPRAIRARHRQRGHRHRGHGATVLAVAVVGARRRGAGPGDDRLAGLGVDARPPLLDRPGARAGDRLPAHRPG
ncbi:MAG TPA: acyltransferase, partial [Polyangia bacterium]|nr:acyltransferase [Polyangia bacterium]